ncbi:LamG-like jellyroll fold domain-containing protein, partial [Cellulomonas composti]|uniref:LamG-like jellyroll fold domain-containing protein n=1 Tax=Cellulomonas composti TaxID=266130 RepID=UPI0011BED5D4
HSLSVTAVDKAGNPSEAGPRRYEFEVAGAQVSGQWFLDEGTGTTAAAHTGDGETVTKALTLDTTLIEWVYGPGGAGDRALKFSTLDSAHTSGNVVTTGGTFSVGAFVKLNDLTATGTAVSQDGANTSGFELGVRTSGCPGSRTICWAFSRKTTDTVGATVVTATSEVAVTAGDWFYLVGQYNKAAQKMQLWVCRADVAGVDPKSTGMLDVSDSYTPWVASGDFRVGTAFGDGGLTRRWRGAVGAVRTYSGGFLGADEVAADCGYKVP